MIKYGIIGVVMILIATAVVATFQSGSDLEPSYDPISGTASLDFESRFSALEKAIDEERQGRLDLQAQVEDLRNENEQLAALLSGSESFDRTALVDENGSTESADALRERLQERRNNGAQNSEERQVTALVEVGFDEFQAQEIIRTTERIQMEMLNAQYEASQNGERINNGDLALQATQQLRSELGDTDYERYLEATNQSTSVDVRNVLESSPAQLAGLQEGDEILSYNGERVFNTNDLNRLSSASELSGNVVVEVLRDGVPTSVSLPVGPLGITSGRNGGR